MKKKNILMLMILLSTVFTKTQTQETYKITPLRYYCTHLSTNILSLFAMVPFAMCLEETVTKEKDPLIKMIASFIMAGWTIGGAVVFYKTPQWTDTYILKLPTHRTTVQNVFSACIRLLIFPLGSLLSEIIIKEE